MLDIVTQSPSTLAFINGATLRELVPMADAIELVQRAMIDLSNGRTLAPERWAVPISSVDKLGFMPGAAPDLGYFGAKLISLFQAPVGPSHQGLMVLFDFETGSPAAVVDGATLTGLRTAAATAVATRALARPDARSVAFLGCGDQARWHVEALLAVRPIQTIHLWSRTPRRSAALAAAIASLPVEVIVHSEARQAVEAADIVCTVSSAAQPIVLGDWLRPGQHINLVGSSTHHSREIDDAGVARGYYVVDDRAHALSQAGELRHAMAAGLVTELHIAGEIGEVLAGRCGGRTDEAMITVYKSLGHVAQDIVVAEAALARGRDRDRIVETAW